MSAADHTIEERILILAPHGRDAEVIHQVLLRDGFSGGAVANVEALVTGLQQGAGACVIAEEALRDSSVKQLLAWLGTQEPWSDFPFVVLVARGGGHTQAARSTFDQLGNIILLERPLNAETLRSAAASGLRARRRQYEARRILAERTLASDSLRDSRAELLQLNETLESRIEERTRALAQANDRLMNEVIERERVQLAMVQLQKMEAVGRLTGGIAHDFNNLLNVIQGSMDLILLLSQDANARNKAEVARRACERGAKLTSQLLAFSRNQRLNLRATPVRAMFDGVRELMATSLGSGVKLEFDVADDVGLVMADTNQMEMALLNLAINARDVMPDGGKLTVSASTASPPEGLLPPGRYCRIAVTDNGPGIDPAIVGKVFEPFFTTKSVGKGTGLGLSQVYGMAQQSGGTARIVNAEGGGTTIEIWLQLAQQAEAEASAPVAIAPKPAGDGVRILVVEDDKSVRQSMVELLETLGYQVSQADDGEAGLRELRRAKPHLMITDYLMPGMTGAQLVAAANVEFPGLPMIIATGYADMEAIDAVIGDNTVLRKPFHLGQLAATVDHALRR
ncbi:blue-light-activated protein [Duganella phyllosphaerae]|uniref:histidine kinase n=2 Tax=Duganella phyllosphaerae TaxID=762836 RepID=A0A1E7WRM4_9BURK|nr:blue-light-activated protein [Duganella phyllosphaerae]